MGEDMTQIFGIPKTMVMIKTKDGRLINLGECKIESERIEQEDMDWKEPTRSFSFSAEIEPTGDLKTLLGGGTPRGETFDMRKLPLRTYSGGFYKTNMHRCPRKVKKALKRNFGCDWRKRWNILYGKY